MTMDKFKINSKKFNLKISKMFINKIFLIITIIFVPIIYNMINVEDYSVDEIYTNNKIEERNTGAIAQMFGEFRVGMSDILFLKTERYLHVGIAYAPHKDINPIIVKNEKTVSDKSQNIKKEEHAEDHEEEHEGEHKHTHDANEDEDLHTLIKVQQGDIKKEHTHDHNHEDVKTVIRAPGEDWRGIIGKLEREVKPWRDPSLPHLLSPGTELLPWYRLITLSNPKNIRGYVIGSFWLLSNNNVKQTNEALKFINEGLKNNPKSFQLYLMRGRIFLRLNDNKRALENFTKARQLAIAQRPKEGTDNPVWTIDLEEDFLFAFRYEAILFRDSGNIQRALEIAKKALEYAPNDKSFQILIKNLSE